MSLIPAIERVSASATIVLTPAGRFYYSYNTLVAFQGLPAPGVVLTGSLPGLAVAVRLDHKFSVTTTKHCTQMGCSGFRPLCAKTFAAVIGYTGNADDLTGRQ